MGSVTFRFQNLNIWQRAADVARKLFRIADSLEEIKRFRFAEQLRGAALSMTNNIAEGSGSTSKKEFVRFLDIARKSTFENANMILIFAQDDLITGEEQKTILQELDELSRMITAFSRSLHGKE
jgi:four helix bundle protein